MKSKTTHTPSDHLTNTLCNCKICYNLRQKPNPQIYIDEHYHILKSQKSRNTSTLRSLQNLDKQQNSIQGFQWYLRKLAYKSKTLPDFPILDTMIMQKGQMLFYVFYQNGKVKLQLNSLVSNQQLKSKIGETYPYPLSMVKQKLLDKKMMNDIEYQKSKHKQKNPTFEWAQLDHQAQKMIKQFQKKIKFTDQILNRVAIIKQKQKSYDSQNITKSTQFKLKQSLKDSLNSLNTNNNIEIQEKILSRYEFSNLFDKTRMKVCQLTDIAYLQLFPIMYGEEERSKVKQVKYFKHLQCKKQLFKQAQNYVFAWVDKNQTLQKMQQQFINTYFYKKQNLRLPAQYPHTSTLRLKPNIEQQYLTYISFKILLHLQIQANLQITQCLLEYITPDDGATYYLKQINYIKYEQKPQVEVKQNKLPTYKSIDKQDYIHDLQKSMRKIFQNLQDNYQRLNRDWQAYEQKSINDRKQSDRVFQTGKELKQQAQSRSLRYQQSQFFSTLNNATDSLSQYESFTPPQFTKTFNKSNSPSFHQILKSNDQSYKEQMLGLSAKSKNNLSKHSKKLFNNSK